MKSVFTEPLFREIKTDNKSARSSVIKKLNTESAGTARLSIEEDEHQNIKLILKKDSNDAIREITFVCSCGKSKSVMLDYSE